MRNNNKINMYQKILRLDEVYNELRIDLSASKAKLYQNLTVNETIFFDDFQKILDIVFTSDYKSMMWLSNEEELLDYYKKVKEFVDLVSERIETKAKGLMDEILVVYADGTIGETTESIGLDNWIYLGNGKFKAQEGATLSHLQEATGRDWHTSDYDGDPEKLQIGQVVTFEATKEVNQTTSTALDNWIYLGNGKFEEKSEDVLNPPKLVDLQSNQWIVDDDGSGITAYYRRDTDIFAYHYVVGDSVTDNIAKFIAPVSNAAAFLFNEPIAIADAIDKFLFSKGIDLNALNNIPDAYMLAQAARHIRYIVPVLKGVSVVEDVIKPMQIHHFATNKNKKYTPQFEKIVGKYKLNLDDGTWNTDILPHTGRHPDAYHDFVLGNMNEIDALANGDKQLFLELFDGLKNEIKSNPDMLYKAYWENIK